MIDCSCHKMNGGPNLWFHGRFLSFNTKFWYIFAKKTMGEANWKQWAVCDRTWSTLQTLDWNSLTSIKFSKGGCHQTADSLWRVVLVSWELWVMSQNCQSIVARDVGSRAGMTSKLSLSRTEAEHRTTRTAGRKTWRPPRLTTVTFQLHHTALIQLTFSCVPSQHNTHQVQGLEGRYFYRIKFQNSLLSSKSRLLIPIFTPRALRS